jgi:hypothetical protein
MGGWVGAGLLQLRSVGWVGGCVLGCCSSGVWDGWVGGVLGCCSSGVWDGWVGVCWAAAAQESGMGGWGVCWAAAAQECGMGGWVWADEPRLPSIVVGD